MSTETINKPIEILLVEDKPGDTLLFRETLAGSGAYQFDLTCVEKFGEANKRLSEKQYDVILLDISMADNQGFETFVNVRMRAPKIPIILLSDINDEELAVRSLQNGAQDYLIKGHFNSGMLGRAIRYAIERHRIMAELERARQKEHKLAYFDALTKLPNRRLFFDRLNQALSHAQRYKQKVALMYIDLDGFKLVNDSLGHDVGDLLLKEVAKRLKSCLRKSDTVARIGGDEFTCMLLNIEKPGDVTKVAQKVKKALARAYDFNGYNAKISGSIGISIYPGDTTDARQLIKNADVAMYHAKKHGKNSYEFFNEKLNEVVFEQIAVKNNLHRELESQELLVHYQ